MEKKDVTFFTLILIMLLIKLFDTMLNPDHEFPGRTASFSFIELIAVALLGYISLRLSAEISVPDMWDYSISDKQRLLFPFVIGIICGMFFWLFDYFARIGDMSVGFPLSILFYFWGAISTEILMHIFPLTVVLYFTRHIKEHQESIFYATAFLLAAVAAFSMVAAFNNPAIPITASSPYIIVVAGVMVFITELLILHLYKKYGMFAPISTRMGFYLMWHVIWPVLSY